MGDRDSKTGALWQRSFDRRGPTTQARSTEAAPDASRRASIESDSERFAFAGLCVFTLLLYLRPNELFPGLIGGLPLAKIVAIPTLTAYVVTRLSKGRSLT